MMMMMMMCCSDHHVLLAEAEIGKCVKIPPNALFPDSSALSHWLRY